MDNLKTGNTRIGICPVPVGYDTQLRVGGHLLIFYRIHRVFSSLKFDESVFLAVKCFDAFEDERKVSFHFHNAGRGPLPTRHRVA